MIALTRLWQHHGITPDAVIGHSQGEIAAAHIAGALTLADSARIVAHRSRILTTLPPTGGMASIALPVAEVEAGFGGHHDLHVAAINGPAATVVTGDTAQLEAFLETCRQDGVQVRRIPVTYASHSPAVEPLRDDITAALVPLTPRPATIPFYSTVTGGLLDTTELDAGYWYRNLRHPVQLEQATQALLAAGHHTFVEPSAHPTLTTAVADTADTAETPVTAAGTLRRDHHGPTAFLTNLAHLHTHGHAVTWDPAPDTRPADLPTYRFRKHHHWLSSSSGRPLLEPGIDLPDGRTEFAGRISAGTHPWLADHAIEEAVLVPGAAFAEMALHAAAHAGDPVVGELTLQAPLFPPERGAVDLRLTLDPPDDAGGRTFTVHARADGDPSWTVHATGVLAAPSGPPAAPATGGAVPDEAIPLPVDDLYERLADAGYRYGPSFRGLRAAWRHGDDIYAEAELPAPADPEGYGIHPALLDAALQTVFLAGGTDVLRLPFAWRDVALHATGAARVVVHASAAGPDTLSLELFDTGGAPVATIGAVTTRPLPEGRIRSGRSAAARSLFGLVWEPATTTGVPIGRLAVLGGATAETLRTTGSAFDAYDDPTALSAAVASGATVPDVAIVEVAADGSEEMPRRAFSVTTRTLHLVRDWLTDERLAATRLAIVTRRAVATGDGPPPDPATAATWGLVRSAQAENPDRIVLVDHAGEPAGILTGLATGEEQVAVRGGEALVPRLRRTPPAGTAEPRPLDPDRTVLITGGTGTLGRLVARHLVTEHGARHLLLASRRGADAAGFPEFAAELRDLGARVTATACDVADREAVRDLLARVPADHPLGVVVHAAGVLADGLLTGLTDEQVAEVFRPKVDAAWHLHELTREVPLDAFVLFSSAAGTLGTPGQGNYAAANAFLDALARHRTGLSLPATSLAWGLWEPASGMTAHLDRSDVGRLHRIGLLPMPADRGLRLLDAALAASDDVLVVAHLDPGRLRANAEAGVLAPLLRGLVPAVTPLRRHAANGATAGHGMQLSARLAGLPAAERKHGVVAAVRELTATVLGHGAGDVDEHRPFKLLGFDSLTAVELRNRLGAVTGLRLPATVVFDHPSPAELGGHVHSLLFPDAAPAGPALLAELDRLESALAVLSADEVPSIAGDDVALERITGRMRRLLARWDDLRGATATSPARIASASDTELFAMLDQRLGNDSE
ncbi:SDR family NAD(P)-dependent oxidoreductase, partial [Amycolatopsis sp. NPDC024027]|uniref:SDR family NAD(P)-dependent oxidoreductase n=1 Tax=Amycolatopsis sp. NPDC024027 TaxID=3154327 RepID=UPI0033ECC803